MNFATLLAAAVLLLCSETWAQGSVNQGIRLAESPLGEHAGRVEVMYNGRWGTICDQGWSSYDAAVVCRMLNYNGYICAVSSGTTTFGEGTGPVWLYNLRCGFFDDSLDDCRNNNLQPSGICSHSRDAAVICQDGNAMSVPYNITKVGGTTRSLEISWNLPFIPPLIRAIDFRIYYKSSVTTYFSYTTYHTTVAEDSSEFNYTLSYLERNETYEIYIRAEGEYRWCSYRELVGNNSETVFLTTDAVAPPSTLPMRLVPDNAATPYIGRLEVRYNGQWGSVCDDGFYRDEANVACYALNYTRGAICYATSGITYGTGPFWLSNLDCSRTDRFDDCTHSGWGVHTCSRFEEIGLICDPGEGYITSPSVTGLRATKITMNTITLEWDPITFTGNYRILYEFSDSNYSRYVYNYRGIKEYTLTRLRLGNYTIQIRTETTFSSYRGNCYYSRTVGEYSNPIIVETQETVPDVSTVNYHVSILNSTAVEATWGLPYSGLNGIVRGFKIFVDKYNESETVINVPDNTTEAYIITGLQPTARYSFSMLIYTVGDGPQGIHLTINMPGSDFIPIISRQFGIYGDGIERVTKYPYNRGFNVFCSSSVPNVTIYWQFANGSRIGINNPGFREGHFENGTAVLQIGTGLSYIRSLTLCDGGVYTCVAATPKLENKRNFTLTIGYSVPRPNQPYLINKGTTWIQIGWDPLDCDGGHKIESYDVEYREALSFFFFYTTADRVLNTNYTIRKLLPNTNYNVRIQAISSLSLRTSYSFSISVTTHPQGPSPPHNVTVRVTSSPEVCISWNRPASHNEIVLYKVYVETVDTSRDIIDPIDLPPSTALKAFSASQTRGCIKMNTTGEIYQFQMSAVAYIGGEPVEGDLSLITPNTIIFVPKPGLPVLSSLEVSSITNTSVTLNFTLPSHLKESTINYYKVSYSGQVEWTSREGVYISFLDSGEVNSSTTTPTISSLTPSTLYLFKVSVVTSSGEGEKISVETTTSIEIGDKLAYFQIQIMNIEDCFKWHNDAAEEKLAYLQQSVASSLTTLCKCDDFYPLYISQGEFSCRSEPSDSVIYRARISGTATRSASDMAALVQSWVQSGTASVLVGSSRLQVDSKCNASLDNIHGLDCGVQPLTPPPTEPTSPPTKPPTEPTSPPTEPPTESKSPTTPKESPTSPTKPENLTKDDGGNNNTTEIVGIMIGGIIIGLLVTLLVAIIFAIILYLKKKNTLKNDTMFSRFVNEQSSVGQMEISEDVKTENL